MSEPNESPSLLSPRLGTPAPGLKRIEHYALIMLNSMAAGGSSGVSDADIDFAIDVAERLAKKLVERGHLQGHE
jgi:hypothetical protein